MAVSPSIIGGLKGLLSAMLLGGQYIESAMIAGAEHCSSLNGIIMEHAVQRAEKHFRSIH